MCRKIEWNIILVIPFLIIIFGGLTKKPPVPTLFISVLSALAIGFFYQGFPLDVGFKSVVNGFTSSSVYTENCLYRFYLY
jgi:NhaC family Na+:H+ antiporter